MRQEEKMCGTCKYHRKDRLCDEWLCENPDCDAYSLHTGYRDGDDCIDWEERE